MSWINMMKSTSMFNVDKNGAPPEPTVTVTTTVDIHPLVRGWVAFVTVAPFQLAMSPPKQALAWSLATGAGTVCLSAAVDYFTRKR
jgi:hypothetical protein